MKQEDGMIAKVENRAILDQRDAERFERVRAEVQSRQAVFAQSGLVVAGWRTRGEKRFGPYYRMVWSECGAF